MATITWDNGAATQNWQDANNWDTDSVPTDDEDVIIPNGFGTIAGTPPNYVNSLTVDGNSQVNVVIEITVSATFNSTSKNLGTITSTSNGTVTFNSSAENVGTITASGNTIVYFEDTAENSGDVNASGNASIEFSDSSVNSGNAIAAANVTFRDTSENSATGTAESSVATVTFEDTAENAGAVDAWNVIFGNVFFDNASNAINSGTVTASNSINVYYPSAKPLGGTATGEVYNNYTRTWSGNNNTWESSGEWTDSAVPGIYAEVVITSGNITGTPPNAVTSITLSGSATLNVTITTGSLTLSDSAQISGGTITATTATFNDTSILFGGTVVGTCSFHDASSNDNNITGDAYFYDDSVNTDTVTGDAYVRQHVSQFLWRDYATTTFVTGDLFLQFPELDILGAGI